MAVELVEKNGKEQMMKRKKIKDFLIGIFFTYSPRGEGRDQGDFDRHRRPSPYPLP